MTTRSTARRSFVSRVIVIVMAPAFWMERAHGRWRLALITLYTLVAAVIGMLMWREASLRAIPNVPDPFDVDERTLASHDDNQNAFHYYRKACIAFRPNPLVVAHVNDRAFAARASASWSELWTDIDPDLRRWKDRNADALRLWRTGTEQRVAVDSRIETPYSREWSDWDQLFVWYGFPTLVRIEAARLEARGEMSEAWTWYRALLRSFRHIRAGSSLEQNRWYDVELTCQKDARVAIESWTSNSKTDTALVRRALADVESLDDLPVSESRALRELYRATLQRLNAPSADVRAQVREELERRRGPEAWYSRAPGIAWLHELSFNEPERSRRVARHIFTNWNSYVRRDAFRRSDFVSRTSSIAGKNGLTLTLFEPAATSAPPGGPTPEPPVVAWYASTLYLSRCLPDIQLFAAAELLGRRNQRRLVEVLVNELYRRDHGVVPDEITEEILERYRSSSRSHPARPPGS